MKTGHLHIYSHTFAHNCQAEERGIRREEEEERERTVSLAPTWKREGQSSKKLIEINLEQRLCACVRIRGSRRRRRWSNINPTKTTLAHSHNINKLFSPNFSIVLLLSYPLRVIFRGCEKSSGSWTTMQTVLRHSCLLPFQFPFPSHIFTFLKGFFVFDSFSFVYLH